MKINQTEAKWIAAEFAALYLERAIKRGEYSRFVRAVTGLTGKQPSSASNAIQAAKKIVERMWRRTARDEGERARRIVPLFDELFPAQTTDTEREEMARQLEAHLRNAGRR